MSHESNNEVERDAETVELFVEESLEGLQRIERLLLAAEEQRAPADMMATLFRDIHTIKGTSGFLAYDDTRKLAHSAEDLLSKLRDGTLVARPEHFALLVAVVDRLRQLIESVRATGEEGGGDSRALVERLDAFTNGEPAPAEPAPAPLVETVVQTVVETVVAPVAAAPAEVVAAPVRPLEPEAPAVEPTTRAAEGDGTVRVHVGVLENLMNLMGELVLARNQMAQAVKRAESTTAEQAACQRLSLVTSALQENIMKTRMQPMERVFEKIPRMVRDLCKVTGKQVVAEIHGNATEIDKTLVEAVRDPVMHIVRNAMDHGFEPPDERARIGKMPQGRLTVRATHEGGMVTIEIADDGRGMAPAALRAHAVKKGLLSAAEAERLSDREAIELVFRPGFSTAAKVTDISGRGVGMDVVRTHIERAGGQVELESVAGKGTTIRLKMPLTLAIIPALLVRAAGQRFAIPQVSLLELVYLNEEQAETAIEEVRGAPIYRLRGEILPLVRLSSVLGQPAQPGHEGVSIVIVGVGLRRFGLVVDAIEDTEEIVIKPLSRALEHLGCYSGATVLGDGSVALILDVLGLVSQAGIEAGTPGGRVEARAAVAGRGPQPFVVFVSGDGVQCAAPLAMVARLEQVATSSLERVAGAEMVQYRGSILPVVRPEAVLPLGVPAAAGDEQPLIVFDFGRPVGMAVERVVDIVSIEVDDELAGDEQPFVLGKTVAFGKTTLVLDIYRILRQLAPGVVLERRLRERRRRVLLADDSQAMRSALGAYLRAQGYEVIDAANGAAALHQLRSDQLGPIDAIVTDLEMDGIDGAGVLATAQRERPELPVFVWTFRDDAALAARLVEAGARACINKMQREELVTALVAAGVTAARRSGDAGRM